MPFSLITILVSIQSSEKVGSLLSLFWFGSFCSVFIWVHFEWWGEVPLTAKEVDGQHFKRVCFKKTQSVTFEKGVENIRAFVWSECILNGWCTALKGRSHPLPRELMAYIWKEYVSKMLHLKTVSFNKTQNATFGKSMFQYYQKIHFKKKMFQ